MQKARKEAKIIRSAINLAQKRGGERERERAAEGGGGPGEDSCAKKAIV